MLRVLNVNPKIWKEAIKAWLEKDWKAILNCPNCKTGILKIKDEPTKQLDVINRHAHCEHCGIFENFSIPTITICPQCEKHARVVSSEKVLNGDNREVIFKCPNGHRYMKVLP